MSFLHKLEVKPIDFITWLFLRQADFLCRIENCG